MNGDYNRLVTQLIVGYWKSEVLIDKRDGHLALGHLHLWQQAHAHAGVSEPVSFKAGKFLT